MEGSKEIEIGIKIEIGIEIGKEETIKGSIKFSTLSEETVDDNSLFLLFKPDWLINFKVHF